MMRRGMVLKIKQDYALVAMDNSDFVRVKLREGMIIGQKIFIFDEDMISLSQGDRRSSNLSRYLKVASVIAACIAIIAIINNSFVNDTRALYALISLDINPSFELEIDDKYNVLKINAMDEDSREILDQELIGKPLSIAVSKILSDVEDTGYLSSSDNAVLVSTVNLKNDGEALKKIVAHGFRLAIEDSKGYEAAKILFIEADERDIEAAKEEKLSVGRYLLLEMGDNKVDKTKIIEGRISEIIKEKEIKDDLERDENIQIIEGENLQKLNKIEEELHSIKTQLKQLKGVTSTEEYEKIKESFEAVETMGNQLFGEDIELAEMRERVDSLNQIIRDSHKIEEDEEIEEEDSEETEEDEEIEEENSEETEEDEEIEEADSEEIEEDEEIEEEDSEETEEDEEIEEEDSEEIEEDEEIEEEDSEEIEEDEEIEEEDLEEIEEDEEIEEADSEETEEAEEIEEADSEEIEEDEEIDEEDSEETEEDEEIDEEDLEEIEEDEEMEEEDLEEIEEDEEMEEKDSDEIEEGDETEEEDSDEIEEGDETEEEDSDEIEEGDETEEAEDMDEESDDSSSGY